MATRVVLADDHVIVRQGLKLLLVQKGYDVVAEASDGREAIQLIAKHAPDVAVLDLAMPSLNGVDAAAEIRSSSPQTKTILLTMYAENHFVLEALRAGVSGYVLKSKAGDELTRAIEEATRGGVYLSPGVSRTVVEAFLAHSPVMEDPLSSREREVLQLVAEGNTSKEIANILGISVKTAESHRSNIMQRLDIHETAGLVRYAIRKGLTQA